VPIFYVLNKNFTYAIITLTLSKASPGASSKLCPSSKNLSTACATANRQCPPEMRSTRNGKST